MISARLLKDLERFGFELDFPSYGSNEERIFEIFKENSQRLYLAIPLLLQHKIDYDLIIHKVSSLKKDSASSLIKQFNKILIISNRIFMLEGLDNHHIQDIITKYLIKEDISEDEFRHYYNSFKDFFRRVATIREEDLKESVKIRSKLNINKSLSTIFSPAKLRIMEKIFNHDKLTNTELKYHYKSIKPLINAILNENMQQYLRIIDSSKKYH